jgi:hypothetical protein
MIIFPVSDVEHNERRLPSTTLEESLRARTKRGFEASVCNVPDLIESTNHGFVAAVHAAFDQHYPLVLSPDDIWLCLVQGFATHVNLNANGLRRKFVQHEGKAKLTVRRDNFVKGSPSNDWPAMFSELSERIREHIGSKRDLVVANFSTTGSVEQAASEVVHFDALQMYFEYEFVSLCGIPEITLLGTTDDWLSIQKRAAAFAEFDLTAWSNALQPVLSQIVKTAQGDVDGAFWQSFYKLNSESGGPFVTGWINVLFPYIETQDLLLRQRNACWNNTLTGWQAGMDSDFGSGPTMDAFPTGLSRAPFSWNYLHTVIPMVFTGGFVGVSQDSATGAIRPAIGWAIGEC